MHQHLDEFGTLGHNGDVQSIIPPIVNSLRVAFELYSQVHVSFDLPALDCKQHGREFVAVSLHFLDLFKAVFPFLELLIIAISDPNVVPLLIHPHKVF